MMERTIALGRGKNFLLTPALLALAVAIAIIAADFTQPVQAQSDESAGRIVARLLEDGRVEFGWQPTGGTRILPRQRYFPADATIDRWLSSSPVIVADVPIGRISARLRSNGRIEFGWQPAGGARILPRQRYVQTDTQVGRLGRWLRSTEITFTPGAVFRAVSAAGGYTCGLRTDGTVECWGWNFSGQHDAPAGSFTAVSAGSGACAIRASDGSIECWGNNSRQTNPPAGSFTAVSAGEYGTCGLRETGALECWRSDGSGRPTPEGSFTAVSVGDYGICAIRKSDGSLECGGAPEGSFSVVSSRRHSCAIRASDGSIECWGRNDDGETDAPEGSFTAVSTAWGDSCAIRKSDGSIECWGDTDYHRAVPEGRFTAISGGYHHTCAIRESGAIECWGSFDEGGTQAPPIVEVPLVRVFAGEGGVTEAQLSEVRQRMDHIVQKFVARWGTGAIPPVQVQVHITEAAQRAVGGHPCAQTYPDVWGGTGARGSLTIAYRFGCSGASHFVLAHEYMHIIQSYFGSINTGAAFSAIPLWMGEGSAEWVEAIYESLNGGRSYQALQSGNWWAARQALAEGSTLVSGGVGAPYYPVYTMGFVAVERLAQLAGEQAVFDFLHQMRKAFQGPLVAGKYENAFETTFGTTFGISLAEFYATFDDYLNGDRPAIRPAPTN